MAWNLVSCSVLFLELLKWNKKHFFLILKVLSFRPLKQNSKNISDKNFQGDWKYKMVVCSGGLNAKIVQIGFTLFTWNMFHFAFFQEKSIYPISSQFPFYITWKHKKSFRVCGVFKRHINVNLGRYGIGWLKDKAFAKIPGNINTTLFETRNSKK